MSQMHEGPGNRKSVFPDKSSKLMGPSVNKGAVRTSTAKVKMPAGPRSA